MILTFKDLAASCADAEKDPWKFFDIFPIKDILKAVHPDKWPPITIGTTEVLLENSELVIWTLHPFGNVLQWSHVISWC